MRIRINIKSKKTIAKELTEIIIKEPKWVSLNEFLDFVRVSLPEEYFEVACEYNFQLYLCVESNLQKTKKEYQDAKKFLKESIKNDG